MLTYERFRESVQGIGRIGRRNTMLVLGFKLFQLIESFFNLSPAFEDPHCDLSVSQLSMQFGHFDELLWPAPWAHPSESDPQHSPQLIQVQSLLEHSASQYNPQYGNQKNFQGQASHQIQSHQLYEDHTYSQGKYTNWNDFYF